MDKQKGPQRQMEPLRSFHDIALAEKSERLNLQHKILFF